MKISAVAESGILRISILGKGPDFKVSYRFVTLNIVPFKKRIVPTSKYQKRKPYIFQKGREGTPGITVWTYNYSDGSALVKNIISNYEPVDEIWYSNPADIAELRQSF